VAILYESGFCYLRSGIWEVRRNFEEKGGRPKLRLKRLFYYRRKKAIRDYYYRGVLSFRNGEHSIEGGKRVRAFFRGGRRKGRWKGVWYLIN